MYNPLQDIAVKRYVNSSLDINEKKSYVFSAGAVSTRQQSLSANSVSSTQLEFTTQPASKIVLDGKFSIKADFLIDFIGTSSSGANLLSIGETDALRSFPLQSACTDISTQINGQTVSLSNPNQLLQPFLRFESLCGMDGHMSSAFSMQDTMPNYNDLLVYGAMNSPLSDYGQNSTKQPRGCSFLYDVVTNTPTAAQVRVTICEPCVLSPFLFNGNDGAGLVNIKTFTLRLTYDFRKIWSHATTNGTQITSINAVIDAQNGARFDPQLLYTEISPDQTVAQSVILRDKWYSYPYKQASFNNFQYNSSVTSGSSFTTSLNSIQQNNIPEYVLIVAQQKLSDRQTQVNPTWYASNSSDTAMRIDNIAVSVNGSASFLASATTEQLYQLSRKNGLQCSFASWKKGAGSFLLLKLGDDLPLQPGEAPGSIGTFNFQVTSITATNLSSGTINPEFLIIPIYDGVISISYDTAQLSTGILTAQTALLAPVLSHEKLGGSFFSKLKSGVGSLIRKGLPIAEMFFPPLKVARQVGQVLLGKGLQNGAGCGGMVPTGGKMYGGSIQEEEVKTEDESQPQEEEEEDEEELEIQKVKPIPKRGKNKQKVMFD